MLHDYPFVWSEIDLVPGKKVGWSYFENSNHLTYYNGTKNTRVDIWQDKYELEWSLLQNLLHFGEKWKFQEKWKTIFFLADNLPLDQKKNHFWSFYVWNIDFSLYLYQHAVKLSCRTDKWNFLHLWSKTTFIIKLLCLSWFNTLITKHWPTIFNFYQLQWIFKVALLSWVTMQ